MGGCLRRGEPENNAQTKRGRRPGSSKTGGWGAGVKSGIEPPDRGDLIGEDGLGPSRSSRRGGQRGTRSKPEREPWFYKFLEFSAPRDDRLLPRRLALASWRSPSSSSNDLLGMTGGGELFGLRLLGPGDRAGDHADRPPLPRRPHPPDHRSAAQKEPPHNQPPPRRTANPPKGRARRTPPRPGVTAVAPARARTRAGGQTRNALSGSLRQPPGTGLFSSSGIRTFSAPSRSWPCFGSRAGCAGPSALLR